jgi:hypothetical protein
MISKEQLARIQTEFRTHVARLQANAPWIHSAAIGPKVIGGRVIAHDAVTFFVTRKVPENALRPDAVIPPWLEFDGVALPTDVIAMPQFWFVAGPVCSSMRPAHGGDCIAALGAPFGGTLGATLKRKSDGKPFILSASHAMLGIGGSLPIGQVICHPAPGSSEIGVVSSSVAWSTAAIMKGDAALAEVTALNAADTGVNDIGALAGIATAADRDDVRFRGMNGLKLGRVMWTHATALVEGVYNVANTFFIDAAAEVGDSGAVVVNSANKVVGIVYAANGLLTACTDINAVSDDLHLSDYDF